MSTLPRLNIEISPEERRKIKACAALFDMSIRDFVITCIRTFIRQETEVHDLKAMTQEPSEVLRELWDNEKDSAYDKL